MKTIQLVRDIYKSEDRLFLKFEYDTVLIALTKSIEGATWSQSKKCWHVPYGSEVINMILRLFNKMAWIDYSSLNTGAAIAKPVVSLNLSAQKQILPDLNETTHAKIEVFINWMHSRRYSESTIKTYSECIRTFLRYYADKAIEEIENDDLIRFNNKYILANEYSSSFQNQIVNAIKLFYKTVEHRNLDIDLIHRPKRAYKLPNVLSKEEVTLILSSPSNLKHRSMLALIYACGLRRSELLNLKPADINSERKLLIIKQGKGRKDRVAPISDKVIRMLREYYKTYQPLTWLFEGQKPGEPYSAGSLQEVMKLSLEKAKIKKPVTLHWLRHSYATHLLESGTDLRYIQELLGHKSSRTTEIYTHVSQKSLQQIKTPFDDLEL